MNAPQAAPDIPAPARKWNARLWAYGPRLAAVAAVLALGWYTLRTYGELLSGPAPTAPGPAEDDGPAPASVLGTAEGPWTFAGQPWRTRVVECDSADLERRLYALPAAGLADDGRGAGFLSLVRRLAERRAAADGWTVYERRRGFRAVAFTRGEGGGERLAAARAAFPAAGGAWTLLELTPAPADSPATSATPSLLPLPDGASRAAVRCDDAGRVLGELVSSPAGLDAVREHCRRLGWEVTDDARFPRFRRDGRTVHAWAAPAAGGGAVLFLTNPDAPKSDP